MARCALAELRVALQALRMADTVALQTVVSLAVAALANWIVNVAELLSPRKHC